MFYVFGPLLLLLKRTYLKNHHFELIFCWNDKLLNDFSKGLTNANHITYIFGVGESVGSENKYKTHDVKKIHFTFRFFKCIFAAWTEKNQIKSDNIKHQNIWYDIKLRFIFHFDLRGIIQVSSWMIHQITFW